MKLILGSSSPFRRQVLQDAGILFEVITPDIDEKKIRTLDPIHTPVVLSYAKAQAVAKKVTGPAIIIAADQVIICNNNILEKPESAEQVREWYALYSKHLVFYVNGFTVLNTVTQACLTAQEKSIARYFPIPYDFIEEQIRKGIIFHCAGGIGDETEDSYSIIIHGSKQSTMGLPIKFVMDMIEKVRG